MKELLSGIALMALLSIQPLTAQRIAFGSCSRHTSENQLWNEVNKLSPDIWIWAGDNIYADTHDMAKMRENYDRQKNRPGYKQLEAKSIIYGTWDDHDYGINDGGKFFSKKNESKNELLKFLNVPEDAEVRNHEGVYQSYVTGAGKRKVKIILLDTRYFRDTLMASATKEKRYEINPEGDVLGEQQWSWLESELSGSDARVHIIVSSIQFIANDHGFEKWGNFPKARQRMIDLLIKVKPAFTFFISGDRHMAEISKLDLPGLPYPLFDVTSSGLTHTWTIAGTEKNISRTGPLIVERNFGSIDLNLKKGKATVNVQLIGPGGKILHSCQLN
jgi:alkaline phosphatase D